MLLSRNQLVSASTDDLRSLKDLVITELNHRNQEKAFQNKSQLRVGQTVRVNHRKTVGKIYSVVEIKRVRVTLRENGKQGLITCPLSLIEV